MIKNDIINFFVNKNYDDKLKLNDILKLDGKLNFDNEFNKDTNLYYYINIIYNYEYNKIINNKSIKSHINIYRLL